MIPIRAEVIQMENISAHADYAEILSWLAHLKIHPEKFLLPMGKKSLPNLLK